MGRMGSHGGMVPAGVAAAVLLLAPKPLRAQLAAPDSARMARAVQGAQRDFEWHRRFNLPWTAGGSGNSCDERVGRFCYWHGTGPDTAPPEPTTISKARDHLIAQLDTAARRLPGDGWIAGQRVRYLLESGRGDSALAAARACAADGWWCDALQGLVLQDAGRYAAAESTYDRALGEMPDSTRCAWSDLSTLLEGRAADRYRALACDQRAAINARLWWLAQPFYSMGANDRRTEHFARLTVVRIARESAWPVAWTWDTDERDLIVRYGWPRWFERVRPMIQADPNFSVMGHDPQPSFAFLPNARLIDSAYYAVSGDWNPNADRAQSRYAPAYTASIAPVPMLLSRFLRGDSAIVVAAYDAAGDTLLTRHPFSAALVIAPDERQKFTTVTAAAPASGALIVAAPRLPAIASVELLDTEYRAAGRTRESLQPLPRGPGLRVSDVLLFRPDRHAPMPATIAEAARTAVASVADTATSLGIYWETYGILDNAGPVEVSLTIERTGMGWWQRARRLFRTGASNAPIALRWKDAARAEQSAMRRAVGVDLSRLGSGTYALRLTVADSAGGKAETERTLDIRR
jgi:tetratricopeptide (TPR) repeat protein